jgi:hypothetical protein
MPERETSIVRLLAPEEWSDARAGRLAAPADDPEAFLASTPHEETWDDERWRRSFLTGPVGSGRGR